MAVEPLRGIAESADDALSDRELLRRFQDGQEDAFAAILRRHGTMVLRVCRRVLGRQEDAEDAFQATFLVLARKAGAVAWHDSIGTWLHTAAHRLAHEARRGAVRRHARETRRAVPAAGDALTEVTSRELLSVLDEELAALPEENRGPLILCCLEGMSGDEAARHLGCSESTVKRRLRQAREMLQERLSRRGIALPAAGFLALLAAGAAAASLPPGLAAATTQAAVQAHAGAALTPGLVSEKAVSLAQHLFPAISAKVKIALGLLVVGALVAAVTLAGRGASLGPSEPVLAPAVGAVPAKVVPGVGVAVVTSLHTRGECIRQFAFDGNPDTFFASVENPTEADHFTLVFDRPVAVSSVLVDTGAPNGGESLASGRLEVSADGAAFELLAPFSHGRASGDARGRRVRAVRVKPGAQSHHLSVREVAIQSDPPLAVFRHPVEFTVDATRAPEMAAWAERAARVCERAYPMICDELASDGFRPPHRIPLRVRRDTTALAGAVDGRVFASAGYFEANPHDIGALVNATSLVVQAYRAKGIPSWLVHGVADYVRFFKFEPGALAPPDPDTARYDGDSQETAAFLAYLVATYDPALVRRLNAALRDGRYTEEIWFDLTGKPLRELDDEWRRALRR